MKKLKVIPKFKKEREEAAFWSKQDSTKYVDWSKAKKMIFPNLKMTSKPVPIRFPVSLLERLKYLANKRHIPYQSLLKILLEKSVDRELHNSAHTT